MKIILQCGNPTRLVWASPTTFYFPERYILHPKLRVEFIDNLIRDMYIQEIYHEYMLINKIWFHIGHVTNLTTEKLFDNYLRKLRE